MGMSTHVVGIRDLDGKFARMLALKKMCEEMETEYPPKVVEYFGDCIEFDEEDAIRDEMHSVQILGVEEYRNDYSEGLEVDLSQLPPDIKKIRFTNSW